MNERVRVDVDFFFSLMSICFFLCFCLFVFLHYIKGLSSGSIFLILFSIALVVVIVLVIGVKCYCNKPQQLPAAKR